ncbi:uncharacterized protein LOC129907675 [Episyrphus balteatus]|uniref:uncharacterized protein LOC129907675 n=1 Tax=Episyrphus balteatus TaxID=286459 RepID=UPI002485D4C1|nr:uncharacterized protein LOC129907675 [Episyrphus balteatus]
MNIKNQFLAITIAILSQICSASKYNISLGELEKCEVYYLDGTHGKFIDFFEVNSVKNNLKKDNERLHLRFYLMASNTSNILLSNNTFCDGHCYEIVLRDFKSSIVTKYPQFYAENKTSPNMLSTFDPMPVEIIQRNDGELIVNVPGYAEPLMKYLDRNPVDIKYFKFASHRKTPAKWFYNCQFDGNSNKEAQKMCDCEAKNVSSINSGAVGEFKQEDGVKKQTNSKEKNNEDQLLLFTSKLSATDPNTKQLMDVFWSGVFNRHKTFFHSIVPTLNNFDDNQVIKFQAGVIDLIQQIKNPETTTTKNQQRIDERIGY